MKSVGMPSALLAAFLVMVFAVAPSARAATAQCPEREIVPIGDRCKAFKEGLPHVNGERLALRSAVPPLLISQAGAGNTMTRMLIEYATGFRTGSLYNDSSLMDTLPDEAACPINTLAAKSHLYVPPLPSGTSNVSIGTVQHLLSTGESVMKKAKVTACKGAMQEWTSACGNGATRPTVEAAVVIHRNPFESIWSEYQRLLAVKQHTSENQHVAAVADLQNIDLTRAHKYFARQAGRILLNWRWYRALAQSDDFSVHFVDYNDLVDHNRRKQTLQDIVRFLTMSPGGGNVTVSDDVLECAFAYAESVHRKPQPATAANGTGSVKGGSKGEVLRELFSSSLAKKMWSHGLGQAWSLARSVGVRWHRSVGDVEGEFLSKNYLVQFLRPPQ